MSTEKSSVFQPDARLRTRQIPPDLITYIVNKIVQAVTPQRIILFGSRARRDRMPIVGDGALE
jgi:hypothetical protein